MMNITSQPPLGTGTTEHLELMGTPAYSSYFRSDLGVHTDTSKCFPFFAVKKSLQQKNPLRLIAELI